jgi:subtilase family serine protease
MGIGLTGSIAAATATASTAATTTARATSPGAAQSTDAYAIPKGFTIRHLCPAPANAPHHAHCDAEMLVPATGSAGRARPDALPATGGYEPSDLQAAYNLTSASASRGAGETVGIVDAYDDPVAESDLAAYRSKENLPACTTANGCFRKVNQSGVQGSYPQADGHDGGSDDWSGEVSLDLDMVSAICPNCNILLVETNSNADNDLGLGVDTAVNLGAKFVSNSYGGPENTDPVVEAHYNHPGIVITASTGDSGFGVSTPAADLGVVAVGGTSLLRSTSGSRGWAEITWAWGGSGCSSSETKPAWQTDPGCTTRSVADVSAVANPATGVFMYWSWDTPDKPYYYSEGGTSASSPIIAATYALGGPITVPYAAQETYAAVKADPGSVNDIIAGTNYPTGGGQCGGQALYECHAGRGYDGPTGLGTPNGITAFQP